jgi:hypothetical protein
VSDVLLTVSAAALAIFFGAMLTEGFVLVPFWRSLTPNEFFAWYAANDRRLLAFFSPLTGATAFLTIAAALVALLAGHPGGWLAAAAAALAVSVVAMFLLYFKRANAGFADGSIGADRLAAELERWATWHWARTAISGVALSVALWAL